MQLRRKRWDDSQRDALVVFTVLVGWVTQRAVLHLRARQQQHALALQKLPKSRRGSFDCYSFQQLTRNTVVMVNMNELHTLDAIPPAHADFARQIVDDLGV